MKHVSLGPKHLKILQEKLENVINKHIIMINKSTCMNLSQSSPILVVQCNCWLKNVVVWLWLTSKEKVCIVFCNCTLF